MKDRQVLISNRNIIKRFCFAALLFFILAALVGCGNGGSEPDPTDDPDNNISGLTIKEEGKAGVKVSFTPPAEDAGLVKNMSVPVERQMTAEQVALSSSGIVYPWPELWQYKDLLPHPELYCDEPTNTKFIELSAVLGGFQKFTPIRIEPDATAPVLQSGWRLNDYFYGAPDMATGAAADSAAVTIQRPDIVGRSENKAFYLSKTYGLITVDFTGVPAKAPQVSCALPIPGRPKNFVVSNTNLFVLVEDMQSRATAVLQFDISGIDPVFIDGLAFTDQKLLDARLFNDTLALYLQTWQFENPVPAQTGQTTQSGPASAVSPDASPIVYSGDGGYGWYGGRLVNHELKVIATQPELAVVNSQVFLPEGEEQTYPADKVEQEQIQHWASYNPFLSASGEYLVVTQQVNERHFERYEQKSYYRCTDRRIEETPYHYCRTNWKRVENPDYVPVPASGVLPCTGDLWTCIRQQVPGVSRYIHVPDGEQCYDTTRIRTYCVAGETVNYDVPVYRRETYTQFYAFRFGSGEFVRLDDQLAMVSGNEIVVSNTPFRVSGQVQKHDHINFRDEYLYVVTHDANVGQETLHTLSVLGNSAIHINALTIGQNNRYASLETIFTPDTLYVGDSTYVRSGTQSEMLTISLVNPIAPQISETVSLPAQLQQLMFTGDTLLGVGYVNIPGTEITKSRNIGTLTGFTTAGLEVNSLLFGADYQSYYSSISHDDQVLTLDTVLKRLFVPYSVGHPLLGIQAPQNENRLTISAYDNGAVTEEATLTFPAMPDRTMSINADAAFAFNREFIHELKRDGEWQSTAIFDGEIPESIYYSRAFPTQVQKRVHPNAFEFRLIDSAESAAGDTLASVSVDRAVSAVCTGEQVMFDRDRILVVQEKSGVYISSSDCPQNRTAAEKVLTGYRIGENDLTVIEDQAELELLYRQAQWDLRCLTNLDELNGEKLSGLDAVNSPVINCYTSTVYNELLAEKINVMSNPGYPNY